MVYTSILLIAMIAGGLILEAQLRKTLRNHLMDDALTLAKIMGKQLPDTQDPFILDSFCTDYGKISGARITIITIDGKVIGESNRESIETANHLNRPEVKDALEKGTGTAIRHSNTLDVDMLYAAVLLDDRQSIVRIALPMKKVKHVENQVMIFLGLALYITPVLAMFLSFLFAGYLVSEESNAS